MVWIKSYIYLDDYLFVLEVNPQFQVKWENIPWHFWSLPKAWQSCCLSSLQLSLSWVFIPKVMTLVPVTKLASICFRDHVHSQFGSGCRGPCDRHHFIALLWAVCPLTQLLIKRTVCIADVKVNYTVRKTTQDLQCNRYQKDLRVDWRKSLQWSLF